MTGNRFALHAHEDHGAREYFEHSSAQRVNTNAVVVEALRKQYPNLDLIVTPKAVLNLIAYASAGFAIATPIEDSVNDPVYGAALTIRSFAPPPRRLDNQPGVMVEDVQFGKYLYKWKGHEFILYIANGRDGTTRYPDVTNHYILTKEKHKIDELIKEATLWGGELHNEVWVFDSGYWQKSLELWEAVQKSRWEDVILDEGMKKAIISDVENFFDGQETYGRLKVPWKRGIIYYGPPGNGKTISIKAMMHSLYQRGASNSKLSVPTLYVRTLTSFGGPEYSLRMIFQKARETAPCYLVFEDLDSIVNDNVRSYFLNEVDGLKSNDGILMVGSTNHLDRLDPGISKRPSRFDRKYYFSDPDYEQRIAYAKFWQSKLKNNDDLEFPDELCPAVAKITDKFSFAYMQEAFVASLLAIAVRGDGDEASDALKYAGPHDPIRDVGLQATRHQTRGAFYNPDKDLDDLVLWKEFQAQVKILREELDEKSGDRSEAIRLTPCARCDESSPADHKKGSIELGNIRKQAADLALKHRISQDPNLNSGEKTDKDMASDHGLFAGFEAWKAARMAAVSNPPVVSHADDRSQQLSVNPASMTPEYRTMVLEDVGRMRGEMFEDRFSWSPSSKSMTAAPPERLTNPNLVISGIRDDRPTRSNMAPVLSPYSQDEIDASSKVASQRAATTHLGSFVLPPLPTMHQYSPYTNLYAPPPSQGSATTPGISSVLIPSNNATGERMTSPLESNQVVQSRVQEARSPFYCSMPPSPDSTPAHLRALATSQADSHTHSPRSEMFSPRMRPQLTCTHCFRSKMRCVNMGINSVCQACQIENQECMYPAAGARATSGYSNTSASSSKIHMATR